MSDLNAQECVACRAGAPPVTDEEFKRLKPQIPEWRIVREEGIPKLEREFSFRNFRQALAFTNEVGELAEREGHHPRIVTEYGAVRVAWWTHKIRNLHKNDLISAAKTDVIYSRCNHT